MNTIQVVRVNLTLKIKIQLELHEQFWNGQSALNSNFFQNTQLLLEHKEHNLKLESIPSSKFTKCPF